jgi:glycosyltransferase involved in cell wall biosynthesis
MPDSARRLSTGATKRIAVVSLHFSPGHVSHLMAYGKLLASMELAVCYLLDQKYLDFADFSAIAPAVSAAACRAHPDGMEFDTAIFYNAAMANAGVARQMRARGITVLYVFHEPVPVRMRLKEGWKEILKLIAARFCSIAMLRECSAVLVASGYARALYDRHFARYNPNVHTFPLLFEDEYNSGESALEQSGRPHFSFLGLALKAHDFEGFCAFAKYAIRTGSSIQFAIATRSDMSAILARDLELARYAAQGRILIQHGKMLSNEEMNAFCARSFCVWNLYTCSTQSGALVRAFMTGTPVMAARMGSFPEFVEPGVNGELVECRYRFETALQTAEKIRTNLPVYVAGARATFKKTFLYSANRSGLAEIFAATRKDTWQCV